MADTSLIGRVVELQELRLDAASVAAVLKERRTAFDNENANLIGLVREKSAAVQSAETALRAVALEVYETTGTKAPAPGVTIKIMKEYTVDEERGLAWAHQTGMCLIPAKLDVAAAKKIASVTPLPFIVVKDDPQVQLSMDLSKLDLRVAAETPAATV